MQSTQGNLRTALGAIASGTSLDESLRSVAEAAVERLRSGVCKIWLVKQGDVCGSCRLAPSCEDRSMCLHLKATAPVLAGEAPRVPLVVFRDRVAARGGTFLAGEQSSAGQLLFGADVIERSGAATVSTLPLKGPAGVLGLIAFARTEPLGPEEMSAFRSIADAAVAAIRIADLTSRLQRTTMRVEESAESRAEVEGLLHAILYGSTEYDVIAEDLEGKVTVFSEGAHSTYGYSPDEVIGRVRSEVFYAPEEVESGKVVEILAEAMKTGRCEAIVSRIRKNGERFPARATFTVRRDADGDPCGFVVVERDLSSERTSAQLSETAARQVAQMQDHLNALKSAHAALDRENGELRADNARLRDVEDLNAIRTELIKELRATVEELTNRVRELESERRAVPVGDGSIGALSHEIRSPLSTIVSLVSGVLGNANGGPSSHRDTLERVETNARHLLQVVDNCIDNARLDAGVTDLTAELVDVSDVVGHARAAVEPLAASRGVRIAESYPDDPILVVTDASKVQQILANLLMNAVRYSSGGTVRVTALRDHERAFIEVTDNGPRIDERDVAFTAEDQAAVVSTGGLGLVVARRMARVLGGDVTARDRPGGGATFTLELLGVASLPGDSLGLATRGKAVVVTTADDLRILARVVLGAAGYDYGFVDEGDGALSEIIHSQPGVVLVDLTARGAWPLFSEVRRDPSLAIVAAGSERERGAALLAGARGFVARPFEQATAARSIERAVSPVRASVLVVSVDEPSRGVLAKLLTHSAFEIFTTDWDDMTWRDLNRPDAIVLDLSVVANGAFRALEWLSNEPEWADVPVLLVTARELTEDERTTYARRARTVLARGRITRELLLAEINRAVGE